MKMKIFILVDRQTGEPRRLGCTIMRFTCYHDAASWADDRWKAKEEKMIDNEPRTGDCLERVAGH